MLLLNSKGGVHKFWRIFDSVSPIGEMPCNFAQPFTPPLIQAAVLLTIRLTDCMFATLLNIKKKLLFFKRHTYVREKRLRDGVKIELKIIFLTITSVWQSIDQCEGQLATDLSIKYYCLFCVAVVFLVISLSYSYSVTLV